MVRTIGAAVLFVVVVLCAGSGIAALPSAENDPCLDGSWQYVPAGEEFLQDMRVSRDLLPYGTRCEYVVDDTRTVVETHGPSTGALIAWLAATALLLGAAIRYRRSAFARGIAMATCVLGLVGVLWHQVEFTGAAMVAIVLSAPLVFIGDQVMRRRRGEWNRVASLALSLVLPFAVIVAWMTEAFMDLSIAGVAVGILMGALLSAGVDRAFRYVAGLPQPIVSVRRR